MIRDCAWLMISKKFKFTYKSSLTKQDNVRKTKWSQPANASSTKSLSDAEESNHEEAIKYVLYMGYEMESITFELTLVNEVGEGNSSRSKRKGQAQEYTCCIWGPFQRTNEKIFMAMDEMMQGEIWEAIGTSKGLEKGHDRFQQLLSQLVFMVLKIGQIILLMDLYNNLSTCTPSTSSTNVPEKEVLAGFADEVIYSLFAKQTTRGLGLTSMKDLEQIADFKGDTMMERRRDSCINIQGSLGSKRRIIWVLMTMDDGMSLGRNSEVERTHHCTYGYQLKQ
ncbi:hypothetical protein Tco_0707859 [Tanacetum coccineum]